MKQVIDSLWRVSMSGFNESDRATATDDVATIQPAASWRELQNYCI